MRDKKFRNLHDLAMSLCDISDDSRWVANQMQNNIKYCLQIALYLEKKEAKKFKNSNKQPTRSVLYRSAGSIALQCGKKKQAKKLLREGLKRNPPPEIADEIKELLKECE